MLRLTGADGRVILPQSADTHANEVAVRVHEATGETLLLTPFAWDEDKKEYYLDESQAFTVPPAPEVETELEAADAAVAAESDPTQTSPDGSEPTPDASAETTSTDESSSQLTEPASETAAPTDASEPSGSSTESPGSPSTTSEGEPPAEPAAPTEGEPATEPAAEPTEGEPAAAEPTA